MRIIHQTENRSNVRNLTHRLAPYTGQSARHPTRCLHVRTSRSHRPSFDTRVLYLIFMLIGALTVFLVAKQPVSNFIGVITLALLLGGYGIGLLGWKVRAVVYIETILLSLTAFFLMVPTVSETLRRVPDGHPFVTDLKSPLLIGAQGLIFLVLVVGVATQVYFLRKGRVVR
jgi:hypothetical protein